jgi:hypothetical protein
MPDPDRNISACAHATILTGSRQAGYGQRVAQAHYAIDGAFLHRLGAELISTYEQASIVWHELFGIALCGSGCGHWREAS